MQGIQRLLMLMIGLAIAGCAEGRYPITGETCGLNDPVRTLDANDCTPLPGI